MIEGERTRRNVNSVFKKKWNLPLNYDHIHLISYAGLLMTWGQSNYIMIIFREISTTTSLRFLIREISSVGLVIME